MIVFLLIFLLNTLPCAAQTDAVLCQAYRQEKMTVWATYLNQSDWETLSNEQKNRWLDYQYGYVAYAIDAKLPDAKAHWKDFGQRLQEQAGQLDTVVSLCYQAAYEVYGVSLDSRNKVKHAAKALSLSKAALKLDDSHYAALVLAGNVAFYRPALLGGNKRDALQYYLRAEQALQALPHYSDHWTYWATELCIAQCYEQLGDQEQALQKAYAILEQAPDFRFVWASLIPRLEEEE